MATGDILRIGLVIFGVLTLARAIYSLARRRLTENFCLMWSILAVVMVLAGCVINPVELNAYLSTQTLVLGLIGGLCLLLSVFSMTLEISTLLRKNRELAMQISLLNQENEIILDRLGLKSGRDAE